MQLYQQGGELPNSDAENDRDTPTRLSREELFAKVWTVPMRTLARELGLSDVGLAKKCKRMKVPVPGRGYWARTAAGEKIRKPTLPPLPPNDHMTPRTLVMDPPRPETEAPLPTELAAQKVFEDNPRNRIEVSQSLRRPHPLVGASAKVMTAAAGGKSELIPTWRLESLDIQVTRAHLHRALRVMDAMVKAFVARGWEVSLGGSEDRKSYVHILGEKVAFGVREPLRKVRNEPPKPVRLPGGNTYVPYQTVFRDEPAGRLSLVIRNNAGSGVQRTIDEQTGPPVEDRLNDFMMMIATEAHRLAEWTRARIERERERVILEQQRYREAQELAARKAREERLFRDVDAWSRASELRAYREAVRSKVNREGTLPAANPEMLYWFEWVESLIAAMDPLQRDLSSLVQVEAGPAGVKKSPY